MRKMVMLALLLVGLTAQAQVFQKRSSEGSYSYLEEASERVAKGVKPFVKANFVVSDYVGNYSGGQKELYGYAVEAGLQIPFSLRCLGLQTALRYITKGSTVPLEEGSSSRNVVRQDRKSTRLNSSHANISYAVFCLKKKNDYVNILD